MSLPEIVSREQWRAAREDLLAKEEALARAREALAAERRRMPMVEIDAEYVFEGGDGKATLLDLFDGRGQLVVQHFLFAPEWETGCRGCAAFLDQIGHLAHLRARDTSFAVVSRAPYTRILPFKARLGWTVPWYSSYDSDFDADFEMSVPSADGNPAERSGVSCFLRSADRVFHTYSAFGCGPDGLPFAGSLLDLTPWGRPQGVPVLFHDEYE